MRATSTRPRSKSSESVTPRPLGLRDSQFVRRKSEYGGQHEDGEGSRAIPQPTNNPPQLLFINESSLQPKKQHRQAIRSHVMHRFHTNRREKNNQAPKTYRLQQKGNSDWQTTPTPSVSRDALAAGTPSPVDHSPSSEQTPDTEQTGNDSPPSTTLALYSGEQFKNSSQPSPVAPIGSLYPTTRLYDISNQWSFDASM